MCDAPRALVGPPGVRFMNLRTPSPELLELDSWLHMSSHWSYAFVGADAARFLEPHVPASYSWPARPSGTRLVTCWQHAPPSHSPHGRPPARPHEWSRNLRSRLVWAITGRGRRGMAAQRVNLARTNSGSG